MWLHAPVPQRAVRLDAPLCHVPRHRRELVSLRTGPSSVNRGEGRAVAPHRSFLSSPVPPVQSFHPPFYLQPCAAIHSQLYSQASEVRAPSSERKVKDHFYKGLAGALACFFFFFPSLFLLNHPNRGEGCSLTHQRSLITFTADRIHF